MKKQYKLLFKLIGLSLIFSTSISCVTTNSQNNGEIITEKNNINFSQLDVREFQSKIEEMNALSWRIKTTQVDKNVDVVKIYFFNEVVGYAITFPNTIYKTLNGGESWEKISSFANSSLLRDILFTSLTEGFVTAYNSKLSDDKNYNYILKTEDGGHNWRVVYSSEFTNLEKIMFDSKGLGLVIGARKIITPELDSTNCILITENKGEKWIDVSKNLNRIAVNTKNRIEDFLTDVKFSESKGIFVVSSRGKLYNSIDNSKSWNLVSKLTDEPPQTNIRKLGILKDESFWVAGGTISEEGKWSVIGITKNQTWNKYRLNDYYFSDIEFLSNSEVIASGSIIATKNFGGTNELNKGVILYSSDSGRNWVVVYENQSISEFTTIAKLSENKLFIAGKNGVGIFLEKQVEN